MLFDRFGFSCALFFVTSPPHFLCILSPVLVNSVYVISTRGFPPPCQKVRGILFYKMVLRPSAFLIPDVSFFECDYGNSNIPSKIVSTWRDDGASSTFTIRFFSHFRWCAMTQNSFQGSRGEKRNIYFSLSWAVSIFSIDSSYVLMFTRSLSFAVKFWILSESIKSICNSWGKRMLTIIPFAGKRHVWAWRSMIANQSWRTIIRCEIVRYIAVRNLVNFSLLDRRNCGDGDTDT